MFQSIIHPERFVGKNRNPHRPYFEGWYFRHTSKDGGHIVCFIPGVSYSSDDPHAFIQVISSPPVKSHVFRFPLSTFSTTDTPFTITIGSCKFSYCGIRIDLSDSTLQLKGEFQYGPLTPIHQSIYAPSIMGPFAYLPHMECNHGIISMSHSVNGSLSFNQSELSFHDGSGYIEKDWGKSFPTYYYWLQSNHFQTPETGFILSIARIPYLGMSFPGFFCILHHQKKEYRFATYTGANIHSLSYENQHFLCEIRSCNYQLVVTGSLLESASLFAPKLGIMKHTIKEGLTGKIHVTLRNRHNHQILFDEDGSYAGLEFEPPK